MAEQYSKYSNARENTLLRKSLVDREISEEKELLEACFKREKETREIFVLGFSPLIITASNLHSRIKISSIRRKKRRSP